jgi:D-3-phosphoglycerate dehydrogenase
MERLKVFIGQEVSDSGINYLKENGYEVVYAPSKNFEDWAKNIADASAMMTRSSVGCPAYVLEAAKNLKVIGNYGVGVDKLDVKKATELGIQVTNGPLSNMISVAEYTMTLILALATDLSRLDSETRKGNWTKVRDTTKAMEINQRVLGLVGIGNIGSRVAEYAHAFGMEVIAYDAYAKPGSQHAFIKMMDTVEEVFSQADVVSLHVPLTNETRHWVDKRLLSLMKQTSFIINCARGGIVEEQDLYDALKAGKFAGAGLNCFEQEPIDLANPLLTLENVIVGPHSAGQTKDSIERMSLHAAIGIDEVLSGKKPSWPVNFR